MIPLMPIPSANVRKYCEAIQTTSDAALKICSQIDSNDRSFAESSVRVTELYSRVAEMIQAVHDLYRDESSRKFAQFACELMQNALAIRDKNTCEYKEYSRNKFRLEYNPGPDVENAIRRIQEISTLIIPAIQKRTASPSPDTFEAFQRLLTDSGTVLVGNLQSLIHSNSAERGKEFIFTPPIRIENLQKLELQISPSLGEIRKKFGDRSPRIVKYEQEWAGLHRKSGSTLAQFIYRFNCEFPTITQEILDSYFKEIYDRISVPEKPKWDTQKPGRNQLEQLFKIVQNQSRYQAANQNWRSVQTAFAKNLIPSIILASLQQLLRKLSPESQASMPGLNSATRDDRTEYANLTPSSYALLSSSKRTEALAFADQQPTKMKLFNLYDCASAASDLEMIGEKLAQRGITSDEYRMHIFDKLDRLSSRLQDRLQRSAYCKKEETDEKDDAGDFGFENVANMSQTTEFLAAKKMHDALNSQNRGEVQKVLKETQNIHFDAITTSTIYLFAAELQNGEFFQEIFNQPQFKAFTFESYQLLLTNATQREKWDVVGLLATHFYFGFLSEGPA